jgi:hypothetical protein
MPSLSQLQHLAVGARVQVRCRYDGHWASGFVVSGVTHEGDQRTVRVRRLSDRSELPDRFVADEVRPDA